MDKRKREIAETIRTSVEDFKCIGWNSTFYLHVDIGTICPIDTDVLAWMPLPEPYREDSDTE